MTNADVIYIADLDGQAVQNALDDISDSLKTIEKRGRKAFDDTEKKAKGLGSSIGVVSGVVGALAEKFIELGIEAGRAIGRIIGRSVELASQLEGAEVTFTNIFGDRQAAEAFLGNLQRQAIELNTSFSSLTGFARALVPDTTSLEQFERLTKAAVTLDKSNPEKTIDDVRIALEEAIGGRFISLETRFDIPKATTRRIKELQKELGQVEGLIVGLGAEFDRTGQNIDAFTDTFAVTLDGLRGRLDILQTDLGEPILDELNAQLQDLSGWVVENEEDLKLFSAALGDIIANVINFIGTGLNDYLRDFDTNRLAQFTDLLFRIVEAGKLFVGQLKSANDASGEFTKSITFVDEALNFLKSLFLNLDKALVTATQLTGIASAGFKALWASIQPVLESVGFLGQALVKLIMGDFAGAKEAVGQATAAIEDGLLDGAAAEEVFKEEILKTNDAITQYNQNVEANRRAQEERREEMNKSNEEGLRTVDTTLQQKNALRELEDVTKSLAENEEKVAAARAKLETELQRTLDNITIKAENARLEALIKNAEKREDIALKNTRKLEDIARKNARRLEEARGDLEDDEAKLLRDQANERVEIEKDKNNRIIDAERQYRQELRQIQSTFLETAQDAERRNDAVAFVNAMRTKNQAIQAAKERKDENIQTAKIEAEEQRKELKENQQRQLEDLRETNKKKIEDIKQTLEIELEEQRIANERALEDQQISEDRAAQQRARANERELAAFRLKEQQKLNDLQQKFAQEIQLIEEQNKRKIELEKQLQNQIAAIQGGTRATVGSPNFRPFQFGGVASGSPIIVGEAGPEALIPPAGSTIIPNNVAFRPGGGGLGAGQSVTNNNQVSNNFNMAGDPLTDPVFKAQLSGIVRNVLVEVLG